MRGEGGEEGGGRRGGGITEGNNRKLASGKLGGIGRWYATNPFAVNTEINKLT